MTEDVSTPKVTGNSRPVLAKRTNGRPCHLHHFHILSVVPPRTSGTHDPIEPPLQCVVIDQRHCDAHQLDQSLPEQLSGHVIESDVPLLVLHRSHVVQAQQKVNHRGHATSLQEAKQIRKMQKVQSPLRDLQNLLHQFVVHEAMGQQVVAVPRENGQDVVQDELSGLQLVRIELKEEHLLAKGCARSLHRVPPYRRVED